MRVRNVHVLRMFDARHYHCPKARGCHPFLYFNFHSSQSGALSLKAGKRITALEWETYAKFCTLLFGSRATTFGIRASSFNSTYRYEIIGVINV